MLHNCWAAKRGRSHHVSTLKSNLWWHKYTIRLVIATTLLLYMWVYHILKYDQWNLHKADVIILSMWSDCAFTNIQMYTYTIYGLNKVCKVVLIRKVIACVVSTLYITYVSNSKFAHQFKVMAWNNSILFTKVQLHCNEPYMIRSAWKIPFQPSV